MALSPDEIKQRYPLPVYNFRVTIGEDLVSFSEVSGLVMEYETITYQHGLSFMEGEGIRRFVYKKFIPVTMKKGVVLGGKYLYDWFSENEPKKNIQISMCDEAGNPLIQWKIGSALPVKLTAPTFNAETNAVAIDTLEIMAGDITIEFVSHE